MQVQQDQASQFHAGTSSGYKAADGRSNAQGAAGDKVPAMFGAAAAAVAGGVGAGGGSFAGVKRKPSVAGAAGGKAGAGSNPFARKKAK
jgi:hypothetical protein